MEWRDEGVLLSARRHGESAAIIEVFSAAHGRHAGVVHGGMSRRMAPVLQPGAQLAVVWRARLESHLGTFTAEPVRSRAGVLGDRGALAGLNALIALVSLALPEREAHPRLYGQTQDLLDRLDRDDHWPAHYVLWEIALLEEMGFGLELGLCALTGSRAGLSHVSPRTGHAVGAAGADWAGRLLVLPPFLRPEDGETPIRATDLRDGLNLTGHFLRQWLLPALGREALPPARERLVRQVEKWCA